MRAAPPSITSLPPSPAADRSSRMLKYFVAMVIRVVCFGLAVVVPDWWKLLPLVGAIFMPYFAVVIANASRTPAQTEFERPIGVIEAGESAAGVAEPAERPADPS